MNAATFDLQLLAGPCTPDANRDEYGRPIVVAWVWRVRRVDAFGEWTRELQVMTNAAGSFEEIRDGTGMIWPERPDVDTLGPDRALLDALQQAVDGALAASELEVLTGGRE